MDALPGVGHACGHNLIAISGVGVSIAIKKALEKFNISGKVELLGTPAEEGGNGKIVLLEKGAYKDMSACLMCHPAPGPVGAAGLAAGCKVVIDTTAGTFDLRQNSVLGGEVANIITAKYGSVDYEWGIKSASTDFGNVTYALPSLHPGFAIPTIKDGGNHTAGFEQAAATTVAHYACLDVTKALAATGIRVLIDDEFLAKAKKAYDEDVEVQNFFAGN
ncbi:hypothetical protein C0991_002269 [Blastosporella zonata]|nr:hypothetical protein C0991_002269 [Blastosporella zonata]